MTDRIDIGRSDINQVLQEMRALKDRAQGSNNNQNINDQFLTSVLAFVCLYIFIFFILTLLLSLTGLDLITSVSAAATSISNVGPGLGHVIGPDGNFFILSDSAKWLLSLGMLLGRLELLTVLVLFLPAFWRN